MNPIKLVVSDFHIGKGPFLKDGTKNILEDFSFGSKFVEFLKYYSSGDFEKREVELIINGDFLNLLQIDYFGIHSYLISERMVSLAIRQIIAGHPEVFDALKTFAEKPKHEIAYIIGNHDAGLYWKEPRRILRECIGKNLRFYDTFYEFQGVYVEHGHQYESVNRMDPQNFYVTDPMYPEPILNLPWASLFISTFLSKLKKERPYIDKVKPFTAYIRWVILHDFIFAIRGGFFIVVSFLKMLLLSKKHPMLDFRINFERLKGITIYPSFVREARKLFRKYNFIHTVIFGHTHVLRYKQWGGGKEYFNTGTWNEVTSLSLGDLGIQCSLTYAMVELPPGSQRPFTRLKEWKGGWNPAIDAVNMPRWKA